MRFSGCWLRSQGDIWPTAFSDSACHSFWRTAIVSAILRENTGEIATFTVVTAKSVRHIKSRLHVEMSSIEVWPRRAEETVLRSVPLRVFPAGTVVCSCSCTMGTTAIVTRPLVSKPDIHRVSTAIGRFELRVSLLRTPGPWDPLDSHGHRAQFKAISVEEELPSPPRIQTIPDPAIQRAIAHYLDRETARIDALIAAKRADLKFVREV